MPATTFIGHFLGPDTHTNRPTATGLPNGTLYVCSTHNKIERVVSGAWADYATLGTSYSVTTDTVFDAKGDLIAASAADTAARLPVGTDNQILTADSAQTLGVRWATPATAAASALTLLSTTTLSSAGTFDITGISQAYNDLILILIARDSAAGGDAISVVKFNNDAGSNYYTQRIRGQSTTIDGSSVPGSAGFQSPALPAAAAGANMFGTQIWTIPGYAATTWVKTVMVQMVVPVSTGATGIYQTFVAGFWNSTAAVNRVTITGNIAGNLVTGSQLRIYGRT